MFVNFSTPLSCLIYFPLSVMHCFSCFLQFLTHIHLTQYNFSFSPFSPQISTFICCCITFLQFPPLPLCLYPISLPPSLDCFILSITSDPSSSCSYIPLHIFPPHSTITLDASYIYEKHAVTATRTLQHTCGISWWNENRKSCGAHTFAKIFTRIHTHTLCTPLPCQNLSLWVRGEFIRQDGLELQCGPDCRGSNRL